MLRLSVRTKLEPEEVTRRALAYFGPGGRGLEVKNQSATCASFEGGGGTVEVVACADDKGTSAEIVSQEWESAAKEFARALA
ncbi:MAG: hypothetical protein HYX95_02045 [Chloroflexi bacterium]|nr:hypothetical protein [Chloroflexota bacterium]